MICFESVPVITCLYAAGKFYPLPLFLPLVAPIVPSLQIIMFDTLLTFLILHFMFLFFLHTVFILSQSLFAILWIHPQCIHHFCFFSKGKSPAASALLTVFLGDRLIVLAN